MTASGSSGSTAPNPVLCETLTALLRPGGEPSLPCGPDVPVGSRVGPYIILGRLGVGGMGQVFLGGIPGWIGRSP